MGGGLATAMPQPTYMDLMPQQMGIPREAQGIMASSQPLVDAIAADANNPYGGDTLSMAQGGVAKFQRGGVQYDPSEVVTSERVNQRPRTPSENLQLLFPAERAAGLLDQIGIGKGPGELYSDEPSFTRRIVGMVPGRAGTALEGAAQLGETIGNVVDSFLGARFRGQGNILSYLFSEEEEASGRSLNERYGLKEILSRISPELRRQNPNIERDILEIGANLIGKTGSTQEFMETVADQYAQIQEAPYRMEEGDEQEFAQDDSIRQVDDFTIAQQPVGDESLNYRDELNKKIDEYRIAMAESARPGGNPDAQMEFAQKLSADPNFSQAFKDEVFQSADVGSPVDAGAVITPEEPTEKPSVSGRTASIREMPSDESDFEGLVPRGGQEQAAAATEDAMFSAELDDTLVGGSGPTGTETPVTSASNPEKPPVMARDSDLFAALTQTGKKTDEDVQAAGLDSVVSRALKKTEGDQTVDVNVLKQDLEALLPTVEDDPETTGLLTILLGASIAGGESPNWLTNVKNGMQAALPALINHKENIKSKKRERDMSIAKMAIQQKLSLEAEQRAEARTIATEGRAEARAIRTENRAAERAKLKTKQYITLRPTDIDRGALVDGEEGTITIPRLMPLTLDGYGVDRLQKLGVPIIEVGKPTLKLEDILTGSGTASLDAKELNRLYTEPRAAPSAPFKSFGDDFNYRYMEPKYSAIVAANASGQPLPKAIISPGEAEALFKAYKRNVKNYEGMYNALNALNNIAQQNRLVGTGAIGQQIGTALKGLSGAKLTKGFGIDKFASQLLGNIPGSAKFETLSDRDKFTTKGRLLLAKMAPIILGESGRTISDADRIRVARSLGFEVDAGVDQNGEPIFRGITGFDSKILQNPKTVMAAINETAALVRDRYEKIHSIYAQEMSRFNVNVPGLKPFAPNLSRQKKPLLRFNLTE